MLDLSIPIHQQWPLPLRETYHLLAFLLLSQRQGHQARRQTYKDPLRFGDETARILGVKLHLRQVSPQDIMGSVFELCERRTSYVLFSQYFSTRPLRPRHAYQEQPRVRDRIARNSGVKLYLCCASHGQINDRAIDVRGRRTRAASNLEMGLSKSWAIVTVNSGKHSSLVPDHLRLR
jgi:hypothetical protein